MKKIILIVLIVLAGVVVRYAIDKYKDNTYNTHVKDTTASAVNSWAGSQGDQQIVGGSQGER